MPRVFIPAISGAQSTAIAEAFRKEGWTVDGMSRSDDAKAASRASGADVMAITLPQDHRPGAMPSFLAKWIDIAKTGRVNRIIVNVCTIPGPAEAHPFFAELHAMRESVQNSGLSHVVIQPTVYLDNLTAPWLIGQVKAGTIAYPAAQDARISWMSHKTLAAWMVGVATGKADGRVLSIGGPACLNGTELAEAIGAGMGREATYVPVAPDEFAAGINVAMGAPAGDRLAAIYKRANSETDHLCVGVEEARRLGVTLESADAFAARVLR